MIILSCGISLALSISVMNKEIIQTMKILPIDIICPFEWNTYPKESVEIDDIQLIRHPFLVTPLSEGKYLLLEESAEFYSFKQAGITQLPVQIIQRENLSIQQKTIGIYAFEENDLGDILTSSSGHISCILSTSDSDEKDSVCLYLADKKYLIRSTQGNQLGCPIAITKLFEYFEQNGGYRMLNQQDSLSDSLMKIHRFTSSIELPEVGFENLVEAAQNNNLFPPSAYKVTADVRILFIDFPISALMSENSILEKEIFLRELILLREQTEKTSIYQGRVYLMNR